MRDLLEITDRKELLDELNANLGASDGGRGIMSVREQLFNEAYSLAMSGDLDEAKHRISLWFNPKWNSYSQCQDQYDLAMANKRGVCR